MKLLLYCTKSKNKYDRLVSDEHYGNSFYLYGAITENFESLNGKIVAECDFEVEEIKKVNYDCTLFTNTLDTEKLINKSCVGYFELEKYLKPNWNKEDDLQNLETVGYAIHIKNLTIFDEPKELSDYFTKRPYKDINKIFTDEIMMNGEWCRPVEKAPQNMMRVKRVLQEDAILISIQPQWMCKILNGEKTIEVRKKVLKEMLG